MDIRDGHLSFDVPGKLVEYNCTFVFEILRGVWIVFDFYLVFNSIFLKVY